MQVQAVVFVIFVIFVLTDKLHMILNTLCSILDLGRMYSLVSRIQDGLGELRNLLESHIYSQGLTAIEKCGDTALNVSYSVALHSYRNLVFKVITSP